MEANNNELYFKEEVIDKIKDERHPWVELIHDFLHNASHNLSRLWELVFSYLGFKGVKKFNELDRQRMERVWQKEAEEKRIAKENREKILLDFIRLHAAAGSEVIKEGICTSLTNELHDKTYDYSEEATEEIEKKIERIRILPNVWDSSGDVDKTFLDTAESALNLIEDNKENLGIRRIKKSLDWFITILIILNFIDCILITEPLIGNRFNSQLTWFGNISIYIFLLEMTIRMLWGGASFFKDGWCRFDLIITIISSATLIPSMQSYRSIVLFRILRLTRIFRLVSRFSRLKVLVQSMFETKSDFVWIGFLLVIVFSVYGVIGTLVFGATDPEYFGSFKHSLFSLFQVMTLDSWTTVLARGLMKEHSLAWIYFISFIIITSYLILNAFTGVIVDSVRNANHYTKKDLNERKQKFREKVKACLHNEVLSKEELAYLKRKRRQMGIPEPEARKILEQETRTKIDNEKEYKYELTSFLSNLKNGESLSDNQKDILKNLQQSLGISEERAAQLSDEVSRSLGHRDEIFNEQEENMAKLYQMFNQMLESKARELGISEERLKEIRRKVDVEV